MALSNQYMVEAENGFIGMQSRLNPLQLETGYVQYSQNMRMDLGVAITRKGQKRLTTVDITGLPIYGSGVFSTAAGVEYIVMAMASAIYVYNTATLTVGSAINYPTGRTIASTDKVDMVQANNVMYIFRGQGSDPVSVTSITRVSTTATVTITAHGFSNGNEVIISGATQTDYNGSFVISNVTANTFDYTVGGTPATPATGTIVCKKGKAPLVWDGVSTVSVVPQGVTTGAAANMPCSDFGLYFKNRLIVKTARDRIAASDYLDYNTWDVDFAQFVINLGANDSIVGFQPWQEDKFIIFERNSIYYAYIDPNGYTSGAAPGGTSFIQSLTSEFGCSARRTVVNAGEYIFFLSDNGVYLLNPSLDLKLLGNTTPLSDPISDIIARINATAVAGAVGRTFNNRYYLAVPIDGATRNNVVLVYSLLNKAWESIDTFPTGMYVDNFVVSLYGEKKRLYAINQEYGIFLSEELNFDELQSTTGTPTIPFQLPSQITNAFIQYQVAGQILTRRYFFNTFTAKRFASGEVDILSNSNDAMTITAVAVNPDNSSEVFAFSASANEDFTKRFPIAKRGFGLDLKFDTVFGRPTIRGLRVNATVPGRDLVSEQ
jgi:hypothetical protein